MSDPRDFDLVGLRLSGGGYLDGVEFGIRIESSDEDATAVGLVDGDRFTLYSSADDERFEGAASAIPLQLAALASLGPRPHPHPEAPALLTDGIESLDRAGVLGAWPQADRAFTPLGHPEVVVWVAWAAWGEGTHAMMRTVVVADAGGAGIALVDVDEHDVVAMSCTPTDVWLQLTGLLPGPDELPPGASEASA